jgi:hypothetical protein
MDNLYNTMLLMQDFVQIEFDASYVPSAYYNATAS